MSRAPFLSQHHLGKGTSAVEPDGGRQEERGKFPMRGGARPEMEEVRRSYHPP